MPSADLPCGDIEPDGRHHRHAGRRRRPRRDLRRGRRAGQRRPEPTSSVGLEHVHRDGRADWPSRSIHPGRRTGRHPAAHRAEPEQRERGLRLRRQHGDCATYSGWIVSVPEGGGTAGFFATTGTVSKTRAPCGWAARHPRSMPAGNIWAATGNGTDRRPTTAVTRSSSCRQALALEQFFAPQHWRVDNNGAIATSGPALRRCSRTATVLQVGKSPTAYLLNQAPSAGSARPRTISRGLRQRGRRRGRQSRARWSTSRASSGVEAIQTSPSLTVQWTCAGHQRGPATHHAPAGSSGRSAAPRSTG